MIISWHLNQKKTLHETKMKSKKQRKMKMNKEERRNTWSHSRSHRHCKQNKNNVNLSTKQYQMVIHKKSLNELKIRGAKKLIKINNNNIDL